MITINWDIVDELLIAGCDGTQVAAYLGISFDTLSRRVKEEKEADFADYKAQKRSVGDSEILKAQYEAAINQKDKVMLIWLGKQRLGQKEKVENDNKNTFPDEIIIRRVGNDYQTKDHN